MRHLSPAIAGCAVLLAGTAAAQDVSDDPSTIIVQGIGTIETPPEIATVSFAVRGEGETADAATQALVDRQKAIVGGLARLTKGKLDIETDEVRLNASRAGDCRINPYDNTPARSTGACAITGYVATLQTAVRMTTVEDAGTAVGLAGRLGAERASIASYSLSDNGDARRRATAAALADAKAQAEAITAGAGAKLGRLMAVRNSNVEPLVIHDVATGAPPPPPPPPPPAPPIAVDLKPSPIQTTVRLVVTYAIGD